MWLEKELYWSKKRETPFEIKLNQMENFVDAFLVNFFQQSISFMAHEQNEWWRKATTTTTKNELRCFSLCLFFVCFHNEVIENWLKRIECLASALETCTHKFLDSIVLKYPLTVLQSYSLCNCERVHFITYKKITTVERLSSPNISAKESEQSGL